MKSLLHGSWNSSSDEYQVLSRANSGDPPYVQQQRGLSSLLAGVAFVPMMLGASLRPLSARIVERAGPVAAFGLKQLREGAASAGLREVTGPAALTDKARPSHARRRSR